MAGAIVKKDTRLFLFRTLDFGLEHGFFDSRFVEKLEKEGAELSFGFAKRYYRVVYEAFLRQAAFNVLGAINLGLLLVSDQRINEAALVLKRKGAVGLFREGWTGIIKLSGLKRSFFPDDDFEIEKDYAERFSAEPGRDWIGLEEYQKSLARYSRLSLKREFEEWMIDFYAIEKDESDRDLNTILFSVLLDNDNPHAPLTGDREIDVIAEKIASGKTEEVSRIFENFALKIPEYFSSVYHDAVNWIKSGLIPSYLETLEEYGILALKERIADDLFIKVDVDEAGRYKHEGFKKRIAEESEGGEGERESLEDVVDHYLFNADDSERAAALEYILGVRRKELNAGNILKMINILENEEISEKIDWISIPPKVIDELLESLEGSSEFPFILEDIYAKISSAQAWSLVCRLSLFSVRSIFQNIAKSRKELLENVRISLSREDIKYLKARDENFILFFLLDDNSFYSAWIELSEEKQADAFRFIYEESRRYFGWNAAKRAALILDRAKLIARKWKSETEAEDREKAPFYAANLEDSLRNALPKTVFKKIKKGL